jgi:peroxiredoxin
MEGDDRRKQVTVAIERTRSGLQVGDMAPRFELPGTSEKAGAVIKHFKDRYRLENYRGRPVLLIFFSAAFTPT